MPYLSVSVRSSVPFFDDEDSAPVVAPSVVEKLFFEQFFLDVFIPHLNPKLIGAAKRSIGFFVGWESLATLALRSGDKNAT